MERPLACWTGKDRYGDDVLSSLTIILKTGGCRHNRCRMCSYRHERYNGIPEGSHSTLLKSQLDWVLATHAIQEIPLIKIYTSGSFFDPGEVPLEVMRTAANIFRGKLIIAETRPEFVESAMIEEFIAAIDTGEWKTPLTVAMGLETTSDEIREKCIDKGFRRLRRRAEHGGVDGPLGAPDGDAVAVVLAGRSHRVEVTERIGDRIAGFAEGRPFVARVTLRDGGAVVRRQCLRFDFGEDTGAEHHASAEHEGHFRAPMPGHVIDLRVAVGDPVTAGSVLMVLEAMKMEHSLVAPWDGTVKSIAVKAGDRVEEGADLVILEPLEEPSLRQPVTPD